MLTKQEQGILDNAPDGMDFYITHSVTGGNLGYCRRGERSKDFYVCHSLADLREKQRKTVVDAVNKLGVSCLYKYVNYSIGGDCFSITDNHKVADNYYRVCAIEEFNQCVKEMSFHNVSSAEFMDYQLGVKIPLEPIKPRTKVEYVKVEFDHIWEGIKAMEVGGETYFVDGNEDVQYIEIGNVPAFMRPLAMKEAIYRKVETEITWQGEVREFIAGCEEISINTSFTEVLTYGYLNGELTKEACNDDSQIAFVDEFIEMCNLVTSLTK